MISCQGSNGEKKRCKFSFKNLSWGAQVLKYGRYVWFGCRLGQQHQMIYILSPPFSSLSPKCFLLSHKRIHSIQDTWFSNTNKTFHSSEQMAKISRGLQNFLIFGHKSWFWPHFTEWSDLKLLTRFYNLNSFSQSWPKMVTSEISPGVWGKRKAFCCWLHFF